MWNEERAQTNVDSWNVIPNALMLEQLSNEHISQDTSKPEVQLRLFFIIKKKNIYFMIILLTFLLQIFVTIINRSWLFRMEFYCISISS